MNESKYIDYLLYGKSLKSNENIQNKEQIQNSNIYKEYYNYGKLMHYSNNLFISYKQDIKKKPLKINLYEFKNNSLRCIYKYIFDKSFQVDTIKFSKYNKYIFIILKQTKAIKILKYNNKEKNLSLLNIDIKMQKANIIDSFNNVIDDINDNIITSDNNELIIWKKNQSGNKYIKLLSNKGIYSDLFNVNDSIFAVIYDQNYICFYKTENYQLIKYIKIKFAQKIIFHGVIQSKILIFNNIQKEVFYLVDLNFLEIVQIIQFDRCNHFFFHDNFLIKIIFNNNGEIEKEKLYFDFNDRIIKTYEKNKMKIKIKFFSQLLMTDDEYFIINGNNEVFIIKI